MKARKNPFRSEKILSYRYRFAETTWDDFMEKLASADYRGALVGPHGSGKTTLLEDLGPRLEVRGFRVTLLRLDDLEPCFPRGYVASLTGRLDGRDVILFDGADLMARTAWRRFLKRSRHVGGLVITSHVEGLLPTVAECETTPELLRDIVAFLLDETPLPPEIKLNDLFHGHRGDLREALRELYDLYAEL